MKKLWYSASSQLFFFGVSWVSQRARFVALAFLLIAVLSGIYSAKNLSINTDTENMLSPELPFRQHSIMVSEEFPHLSDNIIIVIDSPTADQTHYAANL